MATSFLDVDVRPTLRAGGEPFGEIMAAVARLQPGQGLRLFATFKPVPLFSVLGAKGFAHEAREIGDGDWEVLFTPTAEGGATPAPAPAPARARAASSAAEPGPLPAAGEDDWPAPAREMDNRELDPPEPMVRIVAATEEMAPGEVLEALLCREPVFLIPELEKRGHQWRGGYEDEGATYRIKVRIAPRG